jgi:hypothetical protein
LAHSLIVNICSVQSGSVENTREDDGTYLILNECIGTPGFDYVFVFKNIPEKVNYIRILLRGRYQGSAAHIVKLKIYNWTTLSWDDLTSETRDLPSRTTDQYYAWSLNLGNDYKKTASPGEFHLKVEHVSAGDASHDLYIDWLYLDECREWKFLRSPINRGVDLDSPVTLEQILETPIEIICRSETPIEIICRSRIETAEDLEED